MTHTSNFVFRALRMWAHVLLVFVFAAGAAAEDRRVKVAVGEFKTLTTPSDIIRLAVADPLIMDYTVISKREVLLNGKKTGSTSLNVWMTDKRTDYLVEVPDHRQVKLQRLSSLEEKIADIKNNPDIKVSFTDRGVILSGNAISEAEKADIEKVIRAYMPDPSQDVTNVIDVWRKPKQVRMKIRVLEIDETANRNLGIEWGAVAGAASVTVINGFKDQYTMGGTLTSGVGPRFMPFRKSQAFTQLDPFMARLNWLIDSGIIRSLAEPEVMALVGSSSEVLIGGEIPIPVSGANNTVTIEWKEFGIKMRLDPDIDYENRITAKIFTEVSTLDASKGVTLNGFTVPAVLTTRATSKIHVKPGHTVFLSGLKREIDNRKTTSVPGFSSIPVMGEAFINRSKKRESVDLIISVTPYLIEEEDVGNGG